MTNGSRPKSCTINPATAVQKAPVIQVTSTKNTMRLAFSHTVKPLVRRMSAMRALADKDERNVRLKNSDRRQIAAQRKRLSAMATSPGPKEKTKTQTTQHQTKSDSN